MTSPEQFKAEVVRLLVEKGVAKTTASFLHHELLAIYKRHYTERHSNELTQLKSVKAELDDKEAVNKMTEPLYKAYCDTCLHWQVYAEGGEEICCNPASPQLYYATKPKHYCWRHVTRKQPPAQVADQKSPSTG